MSLRRAIFFEFQLKAFFLSLSIAASDSHAPLSLPGISQPHLRQSAAHHNCHMYLLDSYSVCERRQLQREPNDRKKKNFVTLEIERLIRFEGPICFYFAAAERLVSHLAWIQPIVSTNVHFSSTSTCSSYLSCLVFFTEQTCLQINTTDHKTENSRVVRHRPTWAIR